MNEPIWLHKELVQALHDRQIAEHGGTPGVRDISLLESALARPQQLLAYGGPEVDIPALAASCAYGIARNHPFLDGNKRSAYVACRTFMVLNGWDVIAPMEERYVALLSMASGEISEQQFATWLRTNSRPQGVNDEQVSYGQG